MIFKKPYAFFIKYFRLINFILAFFVGVFIYRLNKLHSVINQIYLGEYSNFSNLNSQYIGFSMYLLIFIISVIIIAIILLLKNKKKPVKDYLFLILYIIFILVYLFVMSNMFFVLLDSIVEQTELKLYSDISLLIYLPLLYFFIKYILIAIGFNLKKFDFTKDIIELKADETDSEEIELIFDKDSYKYKRKFRKGLREFKYYILENKIFVIIICCVLAIIGLSTISGIKIFDSNNVSLKEKFTAKGITYSINSVIETKYDLNNNLIKDGYKFIVASVSVNNLNKDALKLNFKDIRLIYGDEYVYANNYFNKYFYDLGRPYNNENLINGEGYNYLFIFQVPDSYKSKRYKIKVYSGVSYENEEVEGVYKTLSFKVGNIDDKLSKRNFTLGDNTVFNKKKYGNSNMTIRNYQISNNYIDNSLSESIIIKTNDINNILLILDYELSIDTNSTIYELIKTSNEFFNKYLSVEYILNGKLKSVNNISIIKSNISNKLFVSVPYEIKDAEEISIVLKFRNLEIIYKIK